MRTFKYLNNWFQLIHKQNQVYKFFSKVGITKIAAGDDDMQ